MTTWEQDAIRQVLTGNTAAYGRLVEVYQEPIRRSLTHILHNTENAREVTQDAFLSAYEHLDTFDSTRSFFGWLHRIARNGALNRVVKDRRQCRLPDDVRAGGLSAEEWMLAQERAAAVFLAIRDLPPRYQVPLVLRHYLEFSCREISEMLDLPASTVRSRLHTARRLLAGRLT